MPLGRFAMHSLINTRKTPAHAGPSFHSAEAGQDQWATIQRSIQSHYAKRFVVIFLCCGHDRPTDPFEEEDDTFATQLMEFDLALGQLMDSGDILARPNAREPLSEAGQNVSVPHIFASTSRCA